MLGRVEDLQTLIARRQLVVLAGAGVSIQTSGGAQVASWRGLLDSGIKWCEEFVPGLDVGWGERMRDSLALGDLVDWLSVASQIETRLKGGEFGRWLEETVGQLSVFDPELIESLRDIQAPILTTNYDSLIEDVTGLPPVTWRDTQSVQRVLRGDDAGVLHLHGYWREPRTVVLGISSYDAVLGNAAAQAVQRALRTTRSLLYVGFGAGLGDPNFEVFLDWARKTFGGEDFYRHYRIVHDDEQFTVALEHRREDRIFVLPYVA